MSDNILIKNIELLEILAEGCRTHPAYRARRSVKVECTACIDMWSARQQLKELKDD
jgi:hypothetical protein